MTSVPLASLLVFVSGFAALAYQAVWLRMFRMLFGASTAASAAVLAIFMGGLGLGGLLLGKRADNTLNPLRLYGNLELVITFSAATTPLLLWLAEATYYGLGASPALGDVGSVLVRLGLALLVLGVPTFVMGGTLPAVAAAVARHSDPGRRGLGIVYGANTLGAVCGVLVTTFVLFEWVGVRGTLALACVANLCVAVVARQIGSAAPSNTPAIESEPADQSVAQPRPAARPGLVFVLAAAVGFAFLGMELVWYRMLGPLLGGSTYSFGMILAVALLGIGAGSLLYGRGAEARRPALRDLGLTCALEAVLIGVPLWLGDDFALFAQGLQPLARLGFGASIAVWAVIAAVAVLPASLVAGYQFPLLIALLGQGRKAVGREVGQAYLWNTVGAIGGSLGVGFVLLPVLGAVTLWRAIVVGLGILAILATVAHRVSTVRQWSVLGVTLTAALLCALATGPTAWWRHTPIGYARSEMPGTPLALIRAQQEARLAILWEADGRESSVAVNRATGIAFHVGGKSDGHIRSDACTQVMSGLVGALLVDDPRRSLVIGLGTGSTAGWLAAVAGMERVDVAELEPAILRVAEDSAIANMDVLTKPNVHVTIADGREMVLGSDEHWDVVFSEPSNPYRAGIASLFSQDFYTGAKDRLAPGGVFVQWLQAYEIDAQTAATVIATMASVFPYVETWHACPGDLLLVAANAPIRHDPSRIEARAATEPYRSALGRTWGVAGAAGFYSAFLGRDSLARDILAHSADAISTDDFPVLEFGFARGVGRGGFSAEDVAEASHRLKANALPIPAGSLDATAVQEQRDARMAAVGLTSRPGAGTDPAAHRAQARAAWAHGDMEAAGRAWAAQESPPIAPIDLLIAGEGLAALGEARAEGVAKVLASLGQAAEGAFIRARLAAAKRQKQAAVTALVAGFEAARTDPWIPLDMLSRALSIAASMAGDPSAAGPLREALSEPFAVRLVDEKRMITRVELSAGPDFASVCDAAFAPLEPWVPFKRTLLLQRVECYRVTGSERLSSAEADLARFESLAPPTLAPWQ